MPDQSSPKKFPLSHSAFCLDNNLCRWVRNRLLRWFRTHQRDLPWRKTTDPYAIWVSEIMLQQTLVATVIPYFLRFLEAFPTIRALAETTEQNVLSYWEGLGYYQRARNLHKAARQLLHEHDGTFPNEPDVIRQLPGFGRYTTGAVLSQAFDRRLPILEANSLRVLCRFLALEGNPKTGPVQQTLWKAAEQLLPYKHVGQFNQALMELGALICTIDNPKCMQCPLQKRCEAFRLNRQQSFPQLPARPSLIEQEEVAVIVGRGAEVFIVQRPARGRWANLWEFPHASLENGEVPQDKAIPMLAELTGLGAKINQELTVIRHGITRYRIRIRCLLADYVQGNFQSSFYQNGKWVKPEELQQFPFSSPQRKLATALLKPRQLELF